MSDPLRQLAVEGVAIWLDDMSRQRPVSGNLKALVRDKHRGRRDDQSDPLPEGDHDQRRLRRAAPRLAALDVPAAQAVLLITTHDVRSVCDLLRPVYEVTEGRDGRVSLEVDPRLAHDTDAPWPRRHDRPLRPPPAAADGPGRHGGHSRDAGGDLRDRPARQRGPAAVERCRRAGRTGGRQAVCVRLRHVLGPGGVGHAGREVPKPDPSRRAGRSAAAPWIANWLISTTFPARSDIGLGLLAYGIYTASAILSFFFVVRFVSETKGKELEEMRI
jgi:hypothetical protein